MQVVIILLVLDLCLAFKPFRLNEEDRSVPPWTIYKYHEDPSTDHVIREYILQEQDQRTYILCPKGYFIGQIGSALLLGKDQLDSNPELGVKQLVYLHSAVPGLPSDNGDRVPPSSDFKDASAPELCPPLKRCLLYQGCVFNFGNEFCQQDPNPGSRKNINVNVTCVRDQALDQVLHFSLQEINERINSVNNIVYASKLDFGIEDFENTKLTNRVVSEEFVADVGCSRQPYSAGYKGICADLPDLENRTVMENTWHLTSRVRSVTCKTRLVEVYCAFLYDGNGRCVPPHLLNTSAVGWLGAEVWNNLAYPTRGDRPKHKELHKSLKSYRHKNLVPARLGIALLVHKDVASVLQLLKSIYRPHHYYVIHVDYRKDHIRSELERQLAQSLPAHNIRVLDKSRSWTTSWGSFQIVRAHLEQFEELSRMGIWDFVINMSGSDLPIRNIDDLAMGLAPYRGQNFFAFHGNIRNKDLNKDQGLCWEAWYGCDGFTYNVTRTLGQPDHHTLKIKTASQWATLSKEFIDYILETEKHTDTWRTFDFHMQTSVIPDESYLSTISLNGPFKDKTHHVGLYWLKRFEGKDKYNLCKHLGDADFCGQGPSDIDDSDLGELAEMTHRYFFARKFSTDSVRLKTRETFIKYSEEEYYKILRRYLPNQVLFQLIENGASYMQLQRLIQKPSGLKLERVHIVPKLHSAQPCCSLPFIRHYKSVQEYAYILDFQVESSTQSQSVRAKYSVSPQANCYPAGDLRVLRVTGWSEEGKENKNPVNVNTPFPFHPAGTSAIFAELWFHNSETSISEECAATSPEMAGAGDLANIENIRRDEKNSIVGDTLHMVGTLRDPTGLVRCRRDVEVEWNRHHVRDDGEGNRVERAVMVTMDCGVMEAGLWTLSFTKRDSLTPFNYTSRLLLLPAVGELANLGQQPPVAETDLLQGMWKLDDIALLPLDDFYGDGLSRFLGGTSGSAQTSTSRLPSENKSYSSQLSELNLMTWLACQGGLLGLSICGLISHHLLYRSRHTRAVYHVITALLVASLTQILLCSWLCRD